MQVDFQIFPDKALLKFPIDGFKTEKDYQDALALIIVVCADFYVDPELTTAQLQELVTSNENPDKAQFEVEIDEEGVSAQFL